MCDAVCDFCGTVPVVRTFVCIPHDMATAKVPIVINGDTFDKITLSDGDGMWAACRECEVLIEARDADGVAKRTVLVYAAANDNPYIDMKTATETLAFVKNGQAKFFETVYL